MRAGEKNKHHSQIVTTDFYFFEFKNDFYNHSKSSAPKSQLTIYGVIIVVVGERGVAGAGWFENIRRAVGEKIDWRSDRWKVWCKAD